MNMAKKKVGLIEKVVVKGKKDVRALAKFDSGAARTSIDKALAKKAGLGPVIKKKSIKSSLGKSRRSVVEAKMKIKGKIYKVEATLANRTHSVCKVLIGRDIILKNFIIDVSKTHKGIKEKDFRT